MITVILRGGLGNQMFEYSLGFALAKKYKTDLVLDTTYLRDRFPRPHFVYRNYDLGIFDIKPHFSDLSHLANTFPIPGVWFGLDLGLAVAGDALGFKKFVREKNSAHFDPKVLESGKNTCLWGFWQSPAYFESVKDELRQLFRFRNPLPEDALPIAQKIRATNSIALSVRRGDYVRGNNVNFYGETNVRYYESAIQYMATQVPSPHFFIFSDDIAWCKEHVKPDFPTVYVPEVLPRLTTGATLALASSCKHQIIANSTFWWWGAWMNENPQKIVVAPKQWLVGQDADDVVPGEWIRM